MKRTLGIVLVTFAAALSLLRPAHGYTHVVGKNESLSLIARNAYGSASRETLLSLANGLDRQGGSVVRAGMRLEVPAPTYYRAKPGDTWAELSDRFLGDKSRADLLARANQAVAWVPPSEGQQVEVPAVFSHVASESDTMPELARIYLGNPNRAWELDRFNLRKDGAPLAKGEVVLVPVEGLSLTREAEEEAREGSAGEAKSAGHNAQKRVDAVLPQMLSDVEHGRYLEAVVKGNQLLGLTELSRAEEVLIDKGLVEAYAALSMTGLAAATCARWLAAADGGARALLDPKQVSPKIRAACQGAGP